MGVCTGDGPLLLYLLVFLQLPHSLLFFICSLPLASLEPCRLAGRHHGVLEPPFRSYLLGV